MSEKMEVNIANKFTNIMLEGVAPTSVDYSRVLAAAEKAVFDTCAIMESECTQPAEQGGAESIGDDAEFQSCVDDIYTAEGSRERRNATTKLAAYIDSRPRQGDQVAISGENNGGMHDSIFIKVWGDSGGGADGRIALANYAFDLGVKHAAPRAPSDTQGAEEFAYRKAIASLAQQAPDTVRDGALDECDAALTALHGRIWRGDTSGRNAVFDSREVIRALKSGGAQ